MTAALGLQPELARLYSSRYTLSKSPAHLVVLQYKDMFFKVGHWSLVDPTRMDYACSSLTEGRFWCTQRSERLCLSSPREQR
jgi:hypothetical protein